MVISNLVLKSRSVFCLRTVPWWQEQSELGMLVLAGESQVQLEQMRLLLRAPSLLSLILPLQRAVSLGHCIRGSFSENFHLPFILAIIESPELDVVAICLCPWKALQASDNSSLDSPSNRFLQKYYPGIQLMWLRELLPPGELLSNVWLRVTGYIFQPYSWGTHTCIRTG